MSKRDCSFNRHGGYLADIPRPHRRRYTKRSKERRPVDVRITRYWGIGQHYYASVEEQDNPIWNAKDECWQYAWDDEGKTGRHFYGEERYLTMTAAVAWVRRIVQEHFPKDRYEVTDNNSRTRWFYREGD